MDHQRLSGMGFMIRACEVKKGKRVSRVIGADRFLFRAPELWKNLLAVGGTKSAAWFGGRSEKGEPSQSMPFSVSAVPALVKDIVAIPRSVR
jgi:hypothetical protein